MPKVMRAFTLIETIIYIGLFALILSGVVVASYAFFETSGMNAARAMMEDEKDFVIGRFNEVMSGGKTVNAPASSGSSLSVTRYDGTTEQLCASGTDVKFLSGGGTCTSSGSILNGGNVRIDLLTFTHTTGSIESVQATFTISATSSTGRPVSETASVKRFIRK